MRKITTWDHIDYYLMFSLDFSLYFNLTLIFNTQEWLPIYGSTLNLKILNWLVLKSCSHKSSKRSPHYLGISQYLWISSQTQFLLLVSLFFVQVDTNFDHVWKQSRIFMTQVQGRSYDTQMNPESWIKQRNVKQVEIWSKNNFQVDTWHLGIRRESPIFDQKHQRKQFRSV